MLRGIHLVPCFLALLHALSMSPPYVPVHVDSQGPLEEKETPSYARESERRRLALVLREDAADGRGASETAVAEPRPLWA